MPDGTQQLLTVNLLVGDLVRCRVEAICTSTNPWLSLQAGTGGSVRTHGGHAIQDECDEIVAQAQARTGRRYLPMGSAHKTSAGSLPFKAIIHCVAIDAFHGSSVETIMDCVENALVEADRLGLSELAMPVFATGHGRFPFEDSLSATLTALQKHVGGSVADVWIAVPDIDRAEAARSMIEEAFGRSPRIVCEPHEPYEAWTADLYTLVLHAQGVRGDLSAGARQVLADADVHGVRYLLWMPNWRTRIVGGWLAGMKGYRHLGPQIGDLLVRSEYVYAGLAYCFALARFADQTAVDFLTGYLDTWLPETRCEYQQDWVLAALQSVDAARGTAVAARYLAPDGPWERYGWNSRFDLARARETLEEMLEAAKRYDAAR